MSAVATPPFSVTKNFGPFFFAVVLDVALYGAVFMLAFFYMNSCKGDKLWIKVLVVAVMALETLHTAFNITSAYKPLVVNFGNYENLLFSPWGPLTTAILAALVQSFYAWRIKVLTSNYWIVGTIIVASFVQLGGGTAVTVSVTTDRYIPDFQNYRAVSIIWCTGAVVADLLITGTLVTHLRKKRTGIEVTDTIINKITLMTLETNFLTMIWVITDLIVFVAIPPPSSIHFVFNLSVPKMYSTSLLVSLNARRSWTSTSGLRSASRSQSDTRGVAGVQWRRGGPTDSSSKHTQQIYIDVESHEMVHVDELKASP